MEISSVVAQLNVELGFPPEVGLGLLKALEHLEFEELVDYGLFFVDVSVCESCMLNRTGQL